MLKDHSEFTKEFHAIRAKSEMCWKDSPRVKFIAKNSSYLEMIPPIQICVLNKVFLIDSEYKIVYPDEYLTEGVVWRIYVSVQKRIWWLDEEGVTLLL